MPLPDPSPIEIVLRAVWPVLGIALLLRLVTPKSSSAVPWRTRVDLPLALVCGIVVSLLCGFWLAPQHMTGWPLTASDFGHYCESIAALQAGDVASWNVQRSIAAGWLPAQLAGPLGIVDGLVVAGLMSMVVLGAGLYLWGRALHGRTAGIAVALLACAAAPLVLLSRTTSFYPEGVAVYVLSGACAALALRYRTLPALAVGAISVGLALLVDVRGLMWALPAIGLVSLAVVALPRGRWPGGGLRTTVSLIARVAVVALPLWLSWFAGRYAYFDRTPSLEQQVAFYADEALRRVGTDPGALGAPIGERVYDSRFIWGWTPLRDVPGTIVHLMELQQDIPPEIAAHDETRWNRRVHVMPWVVPSVVALIIALVGLRRRPLLVVALLGTLVPFVVALRGASTLVAHPRYFANGMAAVAVVLGVAFAVLMEGRLSVAGDALEERGGRRWIRPAAGAVALLLVVLGLIPSWLSPGARWRAETGADTEPRRSITAARDGGALPVDVTPRCAAALRADLQAGHPSGSRFFPVSESEPR